MPITLLRFYTRFARTFHNELEIGRVLELRPEDVVLEIGTGLGYQLKDKNNVCLSEANCSM